MTKRNVMILATLTVIATGIIYRTPIADWATEQCLGLRLNSAIYQINHTSVNKIVNDDIVTEAVSDNHGLYSARMAVLDSYLCPAFGDKHNDGRRCYNVLYGTNAGDPQYWYAKVGVPMSAAPKVSKFRKVMMERTKTYLAKPENLESLYRARKDTIVVQFHRMTVVNQQNLMVQLEMARYAFADFGRNRLIENKQDGEYFMFAYRRYAEGGQKLVDTYERIADDLLTTLKHKEQ